MYFVIILKHISLLRTFFFINSGSRFTAIILNIRVNIAVNIHVDMESLSTCRHQPLNSRFSDLKNELVLLFIPKIFIPADFMVIFQLLFVRLSL